MNEPIKYISKVEIKNLWGRYDIEWNLDPSVNILSGINGSGKSTVLKSIGYCLRLNHTYYGELKNLIDSIRIHFNNGKIIVLDKNNSFLINLIDEQYADNDIFKANFNMDRIDTFDKPLNQNASPDEKVKTELDKELYNLQKEYLSYQISSLNRVTDLFANSDNNQILKVLVEVKKQHNHFLEIIDTLFADTDKKVDRENNELMFLSGKDNLTPYQLSSGEKQILVILLTVLVQDNKPSILFMDEPEVSLHLDWQRKLIQYIKELNPNVQIILATHSPGIILEGWRDKVTEMTEIITLDRQAKS